MVGRPFTKLKTNIHPENNGKYIKTQNKYSIVKVNTESTYL